jgi:putative phosphoesterase
MTKINLLIGLISDTHIPFHAERLPDQIKDIFKGVELILHAGDVYDLSVLDELALIAPVLRAQGDDDVEVLRDNRVKPEHVIEVDGVSIWLRHRRPSSWNRNQRSPNVIVFGDSHETHLQWKWDILWVNPGSPTFPLYKRELGTVGLLKLNSGQAQAEIIQLRY